MTAIVTRTDALTTTNSSTTVKGSQLTHTELDRNFYPIKITTNGTAEANKALVLDANKDFTGVRNGTITGDFTATGDITAANITASGAVTGNIGGSSAMTTVSGTSTTITGIDSWATRIDVILNGVSIDGNNDEVGLQVGTSGGLVTTGYTGAIDNDNSAAADWGGTEAVITRAATNSQTYYFIVRMIKHDDDVWAFDSSYCYRNNSPNNQTNLSGFVDAGGTLDRIALIVTGTPTDSFDAGEFMVRWR
jgi:hypothetical protein